MKKMKKMEKKKKKKKAMNKISLKKAFFSRDSQSMKISHPVKL